MENNILINEIKKLPSDFWDFKKHNTRDNSHGIHFYPATMIYPISKSIINIVQKHEKVTSFLDPFMGSGTTLIEAKLSGIQKVYGTDLNPLAKILSEVKTTNLTVHQLFEIENFATIISNVFNERKTIINNFDTYIREELGLDITSKKGWGSHAQDYIIDFGNKNKIDFTALRVFTNMGYWFVPKVILSLQLIKQEIAKINDKQIKNFLLVAFSETVRFVSNTRNNEFKLFRMPAEQVANFNPIVESEFIRILKHNIEKLKKFNELSSDSETILQIDLDDTRILKSVPDNSIDLIVTSPPYGDSRTTVAYGQYSRLALHWLDIDNMNDNDILQLDNNLLGGRPYIDKSQWSLLGSKTLHESLVKIANRDLFRADDVFSFYVDLDKCLYAITKKTRVGGYQFWVVGNRTVKLENLKTDQIIIELAQKYGLEFVYNFGRNISNKVMPQRNSPTNESGKTVETMTKEHIVVLQKK